MLNERERLNFEQSIAAVEKQASQALSKHQNQAQAVAFVEQIHQNIDTVAQRAFSSKPPAKCQSGCSHCCKNKRIEVSAPEVLFIAKALQQLPHDALRLLEKRLRHHVENQKNHALNAPQACTFLIDNLCSIYSFRPAVCRKAHSLSVEACAESAPSIPQHLNVILDAEAIIAGTNRAYQAIGWPAKSQELNAAVLEALVGLV